MHISDVSDRYVDAMTSVCKPGDIVRAKVISEKNRIYHLSTNDKGLGILYAFCSRCGTLLEPQRYELRCPKCGNIESRKLALATAKNPYREMNHMKINVLKKSDSELKIELVGGTHGICNLLQKRLLEDKTVDFAGYDVPHPLASSPIIYVRMKDGGNQRTP